MSQSIRRQLTKLILEAKDAKGDTFEQLAKTLNVNKVSRARGVCVCACPHSHLCFLGLAGVLDPR